jgi:Transglycosylase
VRLLLRIVKFLAITLGTLLAVLLLTIIGFYWYYTSEIRYPFEKPKEYISFEQMPDSLLMAFKRETREEYIYRVTRTIITEQHKQISQGNFTKRVIFYQPWVAIHLSDKEKIEYLLNHYYFGRGCYGITCAARIDFDKKAHDLTPDESIILVSFLKRPGQIEPKIEKHYGKKLNELTEMEKAELAKTLTGNDPFSLLPPKK